jgi:hypothetical protein
MNVVAVVGALMLGMTAVTVTLILRGTVTSAPPKDEAGTDQEVVAEGKQMSIS